MYFYLPMPFTSTIWCGVDRPQFHLSRTYLTYAFYLRIMILRRGCMFSYYCSVLVVGWRTVETNAGSYLPVAAARRAKDVAVWRHIFFFFFFLPRAPPVHHPCRDHPALTSILLTAAHFYTRRHRSAPAEQRCSVGFHAVPTYATPLAAATAATPCA